MRILKKPNFLAFVIALLNLTFIACKPANEKAIDNFTDICNEIIINGDTCTDEVWLEYETKFNQAANELDKYEFNAEQYQEIGRLKAKVVNVAINRGAEAFKQEIDAMWNEAKGAIEIFKEDLGL